MIVWGICFLAAYLLYRMFIRSGLSIPVVATQAGVSIYTLHYFRSTPYSFGGWRNHFLGLCGCVAYFFGLRLVALKGWPIELLAGDYYEQMYLVMLTFHVSVTILIKAGISWWKIR